MSNPFTLNLGDIFTAEPNGSGGANYYKETLAEYRKRVANNEAIHKLTRFKVIAKDGPNITIALCEDESP